MHDVAELLGLPSGAKFWRTDLHVHTPASGDMDPRWRQATPADVVQQALTHQLEIIAVTDHNSAAWCDAVRDAARGSALNVFPGAEISTSEGHILAIFDRDKPVSEIRELLVQIGIRERDFGNLDAIATGDLTAVAGRIEAEGGVAIAAHVDREKGFWAMMGRSAARRKQIHACEAIRAFEIVDPAVRESFPSGATSGYPRRVTCVQGSDCFPAGANHHELDAIGHRHCYLSMDEVSVFGLRQALLDPEVRVRLMDDPRPRPRAVIEGVWVSGGFLDRQRLRFSDNINCLIGGTGAGKSLTLELIRYALDQQVEPALLPQIAREIGRLLRFALGDLDTVSVVVRKEGERYLVQRAWLPNDSPAPAVSRISGDEVERLDEPIHMPSFFPVKGFSQSEIIEYAREPLARLSLLDDLIDVGEELAAIERAKAALRKDAADLILQQTELTKAQDQTKELPGLSEEVRRLSGLVQHPRVLQQEAWYGERAVLESAAESLALLKAGTEATFPDLETPLRKEDDVQKETPSADLMQQVAELETQVHAALATSKENLKTTLEDYVKRLEEIRSSWDARFETADREYQQLLAELDAASRGQAALHDKLAKLRRKEQRLKGIEQKVKDVTRPRIESLRRRRDQLLDNLQAARRSITSKRETKAEELTDRLDRRVLIRIGAAQDDRKFRERLLDLRVGSRVQEGDIDSMAKSLHPVPLVKSLLAGDCDTPAKKSGLPPDLFERFYENLVERNRLADLYELQLVDLEDTVRIQFAVDGTTYRDLEALAHGQKCTVVLMIALAEGDFPLLADQPEDALHAPWIEDYIVSSLRRRRGTRQCLFATRSANVLVSADAEQIIALKADAQHGVVDRTGALDRFDTRDLVLYHVEGGKEAFKRRQEKYGLGA
jgi:hypothetical protein